MTWVLWVVVTFLALGAVTSITQVGKERTPLTPGVVAITTVLNALIIWAIIGVGIYG